MNFSPFISIHQPCDEVLQWAKGQLSQAGLRSVQTFDLHTARPAMHECPCPNHGTEACHCQMVILLVYGDAPEPSTLILHGNDGQTWLSIPDSPIGDPCAELVDIIRKMLKEKSLTQTPSKGKQ